MRGVEVFFNFIPATSVEAIWLGFIDLGLTKSNEVIVFDDLIESSSLFLTGNTVYACAMLDLEKDGATVIEILAGTGPDNVKDAFFRFVVDMGAPGLNQQKGGIHIILPPDYADSLKPTLNEMRDRGKDNRTEVMIANKLQKVWVTQSKSYNNWRILRGFLVDGKTKYASNTWRNELKNYPLSKANNPGQYVLSMVVANSLILYMRTAMSYMMNFGMFYKKSLLIF